MSNGIATERTSYLLQELFKVLVNNPDGIQASDAIETLANTIDLTEYEKGEDKSDGRHFDKILRSSAVDAVKAGWMRESEGIWSITDKGKAILSNMPNPDKFYRLMEAEVFWSSAVEPEQQQQQQ